MKLVEFLHEVVKIADHKNYPKEIFVTDGDHKPLRVIGISMVNNRITILADSTRDTKTIHCAQCNFWLNPEKAAAGWCINPKYSNPLLNEPKGTEG